MSMFRKQNNILVLINSLHEAKEKDLQRLIEENLKTVLDMHFLATEFRTANGRICDGHHRAVMEKRDLNMARSSFPAKRTDKFEWA